MTGFSNPIVGGGGALVYPSIHSPNYVQGSEGWSLNKDGTSQVTAITIIGGSVTIVGSGGGVFVYSGTPANGNLIASLSGAAGTDAHGNHYVQGFGSYNGASIAELRDGILMLGNTTDTALAELTAGGGTTSLTSGTTGIGDTDAELELMSGNTSGGIGLAVASFPQQVSIVDDTDTSVLTVQNLGSGPSSPVCTVIGAAPGDSAVGIAVGGDTRSRLNVDTNGKISLGNGTDPQDTNLYRAGAGQLQTDDNLTVGEILTLNGGSSTAPGVTFHTPGFASGTASQLTTDTTRDYMIYLQVGTPGTGFSVKIGATSTPGNNVYVSATPPAGLLVTFRLPAGWFVLWAGSGTTLVMQRAESC